MANTKKTGKNHGEYAKTLFYKWVRTKIIGEHDDGGSWSGNARGILVIKTYV